jgi:polysaccharide export outer membrane protein
VPPDAPIPESVVVEPAGTINLGVPYGRLLVNGLTVEQATDQLQRHLVKFLRQPGVSLNLVEISSTQQIAGEHLVGPDGTVNLGIYGNITVVGLTIPDAKVAIECHLAQFLERPLVAVDVFSYNSKVYYVITQGAGLGDGVVRFPVTGNETVLDAISQINGLTSVSSKRIWIARPVPGTQEKQVLHVDWHALTAYGEADTNFQILPGDRVFVAEDKLVATDNFVGKALAPFERISGFISLATGTVGDLRFFHLRSKQFSGNNVGAIIVP